MFAVVALSLCATMQMHAQQFSISGKFPGLKNGAAVELEVESHGNTMSLARTKVVNGAFKLVGQVKSPTVARVRINDKAVYAHDEEPRDRMVNLVVENVPIVIEVAAFDSIPSDNDQERPTAELEKNVHVKGGPEQVNFQIWRDIVRQAEIAAWYSEQAWLVDAYDNPKKGGESAAENNLKAVALNDLTATLLRHILTLLLR